MVAFNLHRGFFNCPQQKARLVVDSLCRLSNNPYKNVLSRPWRLFSGMPVYIMARLISGSRRYTREGGGRRKKEQVTFECTWLLVDAAGNEETIQQQKPGIHESNNWFHDSFRAKKETNPQASAPESTTMSTSSSMTHWLFHPYPAISSAFCTLSTI